MRAVGATRGALPYHALLSQLAAAWQGEEGQGPARRPQRWALPLRLMLSGLGDTDGIPWPGPWLSLGQMSYEPAEGAAAGRGRGTETIAPRPQDNGGHVPRGQQSLVTQWGSRDSSRANRCQ